MTETHFEIIRTFLTNSQAEKFGLSSAALGKLGINRRTFEINQEQLVNNHLLKVIHEEKHGVQTWKYYDITSLGVLAYLQQIPSLPTNQTIRILERYFPLIAKYWKEVKKLYGSYLDVILKNSINCISVDEQIYLYRLDDGSSELVRNPEENLTLKFEDLRITFTKIFGSYVYEKIADSKLYTVDNFKKLEKGLTDRMTFSFYFYLLNLAFDVEEQHGVWFDIHVNISDNGFTFKTKKGEGYMESINQFNTKTKHNADKVLKIIKKDNELSQLFSKSITEIKEKFKPPKIISLLDKELKA